MANEQYGLISKKQFKQLVGAECAENSFFAPTLTTNGIYVISKIEMDQCTNENFMWVKNLRVETIETLLAMGDPTPPSPSGIGVVLPDEYTKAFENDKIEIDEYVIELKTDTNTGKKYVDAAYLAWESFIAWFDLPQNEEHYNSVIYIWKYAKFGNPETIQIS